jgi:hypothetical protein
LLILCLIIVKMTGPTEITSSNPIARPLSIASITSSILKKEAFCIYKKAEDKTTI